MTREEAINLLADMDSDKYTAKEAVALTIAIKALEHPEQNVVAVVPCGDAISRQAVDEIKELMTDINGDTVYAVRMSDIRQLPSVKPQKNIVNNGTMNITL